MEFISNKMQSIQRGKVVLFLVFTILLDIVVASTFVPVPLVPTIPTSTPNPSLYRKVRNDAVQLGRYAGTSTVQRNSRSSNQRCSRCDDWPPRRGEDRYNNDRNDRYDKERYPNEDRNGYGSRPPSETNQDGKDKNYPPRNDEKGYNNNRNDDRHQGSYGRPSGYDRNKSAPGEEDKNWMRGDNKPDERYDNKNNDDRRGGGNRDRYDDRDRDRDRDRDSNDRNRDRDRDRERDRYRPSGGEREYDRGNGYDNRRPPQQHDDRYDRRPAYNEDRYGYDSRRPQYEDRYDRRPYYPEDRYERRPSYYPDDREGERDGWQSYDRLGNRRPSYEDNRRPSYDRDYRPDSRYERPDDRYNRYDDRYNNDRGNGYDRRPEDDRYRKRGSFRPWDETYRGTSGFDNSGRGYYFAGGRPEVGASSAWGEGYDRGYASSWQYNGDRDRGGGGYAGASAGTGWRDQSPSGWRRPFDTGYLYERSSSRPTVTETTARVADDGATPSDDKGGASTASVATTQN